MTKKELGDSTEYLPEIWNLFLIGAGAERCLLQAQFSAFSAYQKSCPLIYNIIYNLLCTSRKSRMASDVYFAYTCGQSRKLPAPATQFSHFHIFGILFFLSIILFICTIYQSKNYALMTCIHDFLLWLEQEASCSSHAFQPFSHLWNSFFFIYYIIYMYYLPVKKLCAHDMYP